MKSLDFYLVSVICISVLVINMTNVRCIQTIEKPVWILSTSGFWPSGKITASQGIKLALNFIFDLTLFGIIIQNIVNALTTNDVKLLNKMMCLLIPMGNYTAKSYTLILNRACLFSLMTDLESIPFNNHSKKLNENIESIHRICSLILKYFLIVLVCYLLTGGILPMVMDVGTILPASFNTGKYELLYQIAHLFAMCYLAFNTVGLDILYLALLSLCISQLTILEKRLVNVLEDAEEVCNIKYTINKEVGRILRECVILHGTIIRFVDKLSILLSFPLFMQYTCGCFMICNTVLQLTILKESTASNTWNTIMICGYVCITFGEMAAYHWLGNEIIFKSDGMILSTYVSKWYELDLTAQKTLLLLMERSKRPLAVQLFKFIYISLDSMGVIIRWAYSVFALVKARYG